MQRQMKNRTRFALAMFIVGGLVLAVFAASCNGGPSDLRDRVRRLIPIVWAGSPATNPPLLDHGNWRDLNTGDAVTTDDNGEAQLQLRDCDGSIYVFKDTVIRVSTCRKGAQPSGLGTCAQQGTGYFNVTCSGRFIVDTSSGRVTIKSTTFSITYLPDPQLTLAIVFDGAVTVEPVEDVDTDALGAGIAVEKDQFLYTMPGPVSPEIEGVPAREPLPLEELPPLVEALDIQHWMDDIREQAKEDNVLPDNWPFDGGPGAVAVSLVGGGDLWEDERVQEAILHAVDWESLSKARVDREVSFVVKRVDLSGRVGGVHPDARAVGYDPDLSRELLAEAGFPDGFALKMLVPRGDESLVPLAEWMKTDLAVVGVKVAVEPVPPGDSLPQMIAMIEAGHQLVFWLSQP